MIEEIKSEDYQVHCNLETNTVNFQGSLRLSGMDEYSPIVDLLDKQVERSPERVTLDLRELEFLNSSGINILSKFVIKVRQKGKIEMTVRGSKNVPWQGKSLKNLQRLMPSLLLEID